jgi:hypothetical protein
VRTFFTSANADRVIALVADGAPQRVRTTHKLRPLLDRYGEGTTSGRCAALITRDVISQKLNAGLSVSLTEAVLAANNYLRAGTPVGRDAPDRAVRRGQPVALSGCRR